MKSLLFFLFPIFLWATEPFFATFDPPKGWKISDPSKYEEGTQIGFIESHRRIFTPSLTLTYEKVGNVDLKTYLNAARQNFATDHYSHFQELGKIKTNSGEGVLIQVDLSRRFGQVRLLQAISIHQGTAIIHTASCLKEDFLKIHEALLNSFKSLTIYPNLISSCPNTSFKGKVEGMLKCWKKYSATSNDSHEVLFASSFFQTNQWKPFVNYVEKELDSQGSCWQILDIHYLKEILIMENNR
jgi:hypothetical protein